jgi:hypothetical protein
VAPAGTAVVDQARPLEVLYCGVMTRALGADGAPAVTAAPRVLASLTQPDQPAGSPDATPSKFWVIKVEGTSRDSSCSTDNLAAATFLVRIGSFLAAHPGAST